MALITCPECGREKVSDSAEACPDCGFGIRNYIAQKTEKDRKERERVETDKRKKQRFEELLDELQQKLDAIDNTPYPKKPTIKSTFSDYTLNVKLFTIISTVVSFFSIGVMILVKEFSIFLILPSFCSFLSFFSLYDDYKHELVEYNYKTSDWNGYLQRKKDELISYYKNKDEIDKERIERLQRSMKAQNDKPKCPQCGSTNFVKISTLDRSASIAMFGLASSKIGKQYECKNCHHKW